MTNAFLTLGNKAGITTYGHQLRLVVGSRYKFRSTETIMLMGVDDASTYELTAEEALAVGQAMVTKAQEILGAKAAEVASIHHSSGGRSPLVSHNNHHQPTATNGKPKKQPKAEAFTDAKSLKNLMTTGQKTQFATLLESVIANKDRTNRDLKAICKELVGSCPRAPISKAKIKTHIYERVWK